MDPASIAASAFTLAGGIATCSAAITNFVRQVKHARKDLEAINTELNATSEILSPLLISLIGSQGSPLPDAILVKIDGSVRQCITIVDRLKADVDHYKRDAVWSKAKWVLFGEKSAQKARENLEMHKLTLGLALQVLSISHTRLIQQDTELIKGRLEKIHRNIHRIKTQFLAVCGKQVPRQQQTATVEVQRWIEDISLLSSYAESSYQISILDQISSSSQATTPAQRSSSGIILQSGTTDTPGSVTELPAEEVVPPTVPQLGIESLTASDDYRSSSRVHEIDGGSQLPRVENRFPLGSETRPWETESRGHAQTKRSLLYCPPSITPGPWIGLPGPSNPIGPTNSFGSHYSGHVGERGNVGSHSPSSGNEADTRQLSHNAELPHAPEPRRTVYTLVDSYAPNALQKPNDQGLVHELETRRPRIEHDYRIHEQRRSSQYAQFLSRSLPNTAPEDTPLSHGEFEPWRPDQPTTYSDGSCISSSSGRTASETASNSLVGFYRSVDAAPPRGTPYHQHGPRKATRHVRFNEHVQILPPNGLESDTQTSSSNRAELYSSLEVTSVHPTARSGSPEEAPRSNTPHPAPTPGTPELPVELSSDSHPLLGQGELDIFTKEIFTSEDDVIMRRLVRRDENFTGLSRSRRRELSQDERKLVDGMLLENMGLVDRDKFDVCKHLISSGADPNVLQIDKEDKVEAGPLMLAVKHRKHRCLTALLRWGANPSTTVLQYAVSIHNNFAVRALIAAGACVNYGLQTEEYNSYKRIRRTRPVYMRHLSTKRNAEVVKCHRYTLLLGLIAGALTVSGQDALLSQLSCIQFVLSEAADPNWTGSESYSYISEDSTKNIGLSPLHVAVLIWTKFGDIATLAIAKTLLAFGAKPDIFLELGKWPCFDCFGSSPIRMAIKTGNEMLLELLLSHGASDDNYMGISTFQFAVRSNREPMVRTLLRHRDVARCNYQQELLAINRQGGNKVPESTIRHYQDILSSLGSYPPITCDGEDFPTTVWGGRCGAHPELDEGSPSSSSSSELINTGSSTSDDLNNSDSSTGSSEDYVTYDDTSSDLFPVGMSEAWLKWAFGDVGLIQSGSNSAAIS